MNPMHEVNNPRAVLLGLWEYIVWPMRPWWPVSAFIKHIRGQYNGFIVPIWPTVLGFFLLVFAGAVGYEMYSGVADWSLLLVIIFIIGVLGGFHDVETRKAPEIRKG
mgnify:CR=1 FL=1